MLSAKELQDIVSSEGGLPPKGGQKDYCPDGSWLQQRKLENCNEDRRRVLKDERVRPMGTLVQGEWIPEEGRVKLSKPGKFFSVMGYTEMQAPYLLPEEAMYLLDQGSIQITYGGLPLSIEEAMAVVLVPYVSLEQYQVFAYFARIGYILRRYTGTMTYEKKLGLHKYSQVTNGKRKIAAVCEGQNSGMPIDEKRSKLSLPEEEHMSPNQKILSDQSEVLEESECASMSKEYAKVGTKFEHDGIDAKCVEHQVSKLDPTEFSNTSAESSTEVNSSNLHDCSSIGEKPSCSQVVKAMSVPEGITCKKSEIENRKLEEISKTERKVLNNLFYPEAHLSDQNMITDKNVNLNQDKCQNCNTKKSSTCDNSCEKDAYTVEMDDATFVDSDMKFEGEINTHCTSVKKGRDTCEIDMENFVKGSRDTCEIDMETSVKESKDTCDIDMETSLKVNRDTCDIDMETVDKSDTERENKDLLNCVPYSQWNFGELKFPDVSNMKMNSLKISSKSQTLLPPGTQLSKDEYEFDISSFRRRNQCQKQELDFSQGASGVEAKRNARNWAEYRELMAAMTDEEVLLTSPVGHLWEDDVRPLVQPQAAVSTGNILAKLNVIKNTNFLELSQSSSREVCVDEKFKIAYDGYLPSSKFKKSNPGVPHFRLVITRQNEKPPSLLSMARLTSESVTDGVPLYWAVVECGDIAFYSLNGVDLPQDIAVG